MKNIKNIIFTSLILLIFASCEDNDNIFEYVGTDTTKIIGTLTTTQTIVNQSTEIEFEYTIPQSFTNDAVLQIIGAYGANETTNNIKILAGETTGIGTIDLNGNDVGFNGEIFKVFMGGLKLVTFEDLLNDDGDSVNIPIPVSAGNDNFEISSNILEILVHQDFEEFKANISLGWNDGTDLDIRLRDSDGTLIVSAETGENPEVLVLEDSLPDGDYTLGIIYFATEDDSLDYTFKIRLSDGTTQIVQGDLSGYIENTSDEINVFNINKSGISYTITEL